MRLIEQSEYGPVVVLEEDGSIRVGYYDDDHWEYQDDDADDESGRRVAIVYFCEPPFFFDTAVWSLPPDRLREVDTGALFRRRSELSEELVRAADEVLGRHTTSEADGVERYRLLLEYSYVNGLLADRLLDARLHEGDRGGRRVFISHSSTDKRTAVSLSVDLANRGHVPWLDEWEIKAGESIPLKVSDGLEHSDFVLVLMSRVAVESGWVEAEWTTKYLDEVRTRKAHVIPVLLEDCTIPMLLRAKKYADLRSDYHSGLQEILRAVG